MPDFAQLLREALRQGNPPEVVVAALLEQGASKIEACKAVREVTGLSLLEVKQIVENAADMFQGRRPASQ